MGIQGSPGLIIFCCPNQAGIQAFLAIGFGTLPVIYTGGYLTLQLGYCLTSLLLGFFAIKRGTWFPEGGGTYQGLNAGGEISSFLTSYFSISFFICLGMSAFGYEIGYLCTSYTGTRFELDCGRALNFSWTALGSKCLLTKLLTLFSD